MNWSYLGSPGPLPQTLTTGTGQGDLVDDVLRNVFEKVDPDMAGEPPPQAFVEDQN